MNILFHVNFSYEIYFHFDDLMESIFREISLKLNLNFKWNYFLIINIFNCVSKFVNVSANIYFNLTFSLFCCTLKVMGMNLILMVGN